MDQEKILETYYDHYKETDAQNKVAQNRRNKCFILLCILEALLFLLSWNSGLVHSLLNDAVRKKLETSIHLSNNILQTLIWILIAYVLIRYVQDVLYVERQYIYLDLLEKKISEFLKDDLFSREVSNYLCNYPPVLNFVDLFYKFFCPVFFLAINIYHIIYEWKNSYLHFSTICDTCIFCFVFVITWFYFFEIHKKIYSGFMKIKPIAVLDQIIRRWLKEV